MNDSSRAHLRIVRTDHDPVLPPDVEPIPERDIWDWDDFGTMERDSTSPGFLIGYLLVSLSALVALFVYLAGS